MSPKIGYSAKKHNVWGNFWQSGPKKACQGARPSPARNPKLPRDSLGYGDDILMLEKSVGVQKMEVYGCSVKKWDYLAKKWA